MQVCGDAHLSNFGVFASPERQLVFDVNDFDETLPGPWEWDVKRLAASLEVAGRDNGFAGKDRREIVLAAVGQLPAGDARASPGMTNLDVWYAHLDIERAAGGSSTSQLKARQRKTVDKGMAKARTTGQHAGAGQADHGGRRAAADHRRPAADRPGRRTCCPEQMDRAGASRRSCSDLLGKYRRTLQSDRRHLLEQFEFADMARKVVGVGSVGTRCWIVLMLGRDESDPLFLQVKEAQPSVLGRVRRAPASTPTRASGSSPASG